jgi:hypothetical protein
MCSKKGQKERDKFQIGRPWISHLIKKKKLCSLSVFSWLCNFPCNNGHDFKDGML